jgi:hypothetical protein
MVLAVSAGVYWRWQVEALPDLRLALFNALPALRGETLGEFRKRAHHYAKARCEGDYWLPPPITRITPIWKTSVDPDHRDNNGSNHQ